MKIALVTALLASTVPFTTIAATPWESYLMQPTPKAASAVHEISYSHGTSGPEEHNALDLEILALQVYAGDAESLRLALRLAARSDGSLLEDLYAIAGHSIRAHPRTFLRVVAEEKLAAESIRSIVNMPGLEYVDRPEAKRYELERREAALKTVRYKRLLGVRTTCLDALQKRGI